jgi:hypothetical protein
VRDSCLSSDLEGSGCEPSSDTLEDLAHNELRKGRGTTRSAWIQGKMAYESSETHLGIRSVASSRVDHQTATEKTDAETGELRCKEKYQISEGAK